MVSFGAFNLYIGMQQSADNPKDEMLKIKISEGSDDNDEQYYIFLNIEQIFL